MDTIHDMLEYKLQVIYAAEKRNLEVLKDAMDDVEDAKLRKAMEHHHEETRKQVGRVEKVFASLGRRPRSIDPSTVEGVVEERRRFRSEDPAPQLMDLFVLGAAMKIEHIEIASYEEAILLAEQAGAGELAGPLQENLAEERETLEKLRSLATDMKRTMPREEREASAGQR